MASAWRAMRRGATPWPRGAKSGCGVRTGPRAQENREVTEQIDGMVTALKKEKADDIKMKDFCVEELNANVRAQELKVTLV